MRSIRLPAPLRPYASGQAEIVVQGETVSEALSNLMKEYPRLRPYVMDGAGRLRPYMNLFVGENNISDLQGLETRLGQNDRMLLIPNIAGG